VIDALFGIGLARPIVGHFAQLVELANMAPRRLAIDIPSGLHTDTGEVLGVAVDAHRTVTMAALKAALVSSPGFARCGTVTVADIGVPAHVVAAANAQAGLTELDDARALVPRSAAGDHKGRRGHLVVVGGTRNMRGAGRLAALAGLRTGAGLVTLANEGPDPSAPDSVMTHAIDPAAAMLGGALDGKDAIVIGPGLGTIGAPTAWVADVLAAGVPAVLDADALNVIAPSIDRIAAAAGPVVITPHPGEAARLLATTVTAIEADRLGAARLLAAAARAVVVLKGARTIICDGTTGDRRFCWINPTGGPSLATGGSGDVLAGAIGSLLAQGVPPGDAARLGVYVHGCAGDELATRYGDRGVISSDLPEAIAVVIHRITA
jgi:ADP-dependent NAD(P)H-hydrate dehydratase / NAD(P)H-hydrate epimerase